jgi:hypothetical protein
MMTHSSLSLSHTHSHSHNAAGSIHSVAEILFRFLESLAEPIIPFALYKQALESSASYNQVPCCPCRARAIAHH